MTLIPDTVFLYYGLNKISTSLRHYYKDQILVRFCCSIADTVSTRRFQVPCNCMLPHKRNQGVGSMVSSPWEGTRDNRWKSRFSECLCVVKIPQGLVCWKQRWRNDSLIENFMGPTWGPSGAERTQVGPMLAPWTLFSGLVGACFHRRPNDLHKVKRARN